MATCTNKKRRFQYYAALLCNNEIPWQRKTTNLFDVAMGASDGAEVCDIVGLFLLNNLGNKLEKNSVGLYTDDELALIKNINGHCADKIRKQFYQLFKWIVFRN